MLLGGGGNTHSGVNSGIGTDHREQLLNQLLQSHAHLFHLFLCREGVVALQHVGDRHGHRRQQQYCQQRGVDEPYFLRA